MKGSLVIKFLSFFILLFSFLSVFADKWFTVLEKTTDSVKFSWDKSSEATYYQILYWEKPSRSSYSNQTDVFEWTSFTITNLENKTYYFTLIWLGANWEEVFSSEELSVGLWASTSSFSIKSAKLIDESVLRLTFSKDLNQEKLEDSSFKIEATNDASDYLEVKSISAVEWDKKSADLTLDAKPTTETKYKVVVLAIFDETGNNITYWVDSEATFVGWEIEKISEAESKDLNSAWLSDEITSTWITQVVEESKNTKKILTWTSGTADSTWKNIETLSETKKDLPKTWPEMIFILLFALVISASILIMKWQKE